MKAGDEMKLVVECFKCWKEKKLSKAQLIYNKINETDNVLLFDAFVIGLGMGGNNYDRFAFTKFLLECIRGEHNQKIEIEA